MNIGNQYLKVIRKVGVPIVRLLDNTPDYMDIGSSVTMSVSWAREYIRSFNVKYNTLLEVGDLIKDTLTNETYIIVTMLPEFLLGQIMFRYGNLLKCNVIGGFKTDKGTRDSTSVEYTSDWDTYATVSGGLLVPRRIDLINTPGGPAEDGSFYLYHSEVSGAQILDRVTLDDINYKVLSMDTKSIDNMVIFQLDLDTR